ncbi:uncharacterized protein G2W53_017443 [Senna tora]|uniref:Uncharacterized protein n=1 Tax=Senna tora TaxID=362788 RepID=A0A834WQV1_9FABA|nr:uncharacterized protein G2W53_017443 [Senna tora]
MYGGRNQKPPRSQPSELDIRGLRPDCKKVTK